MATTEKSAGEPQSGERAVTDKEPDKHPSAWVFRIPTRRMLSLTAEALVVFLGVWAAFWLEGCRERQAQDRLRVQIHEALEHDMTEAARSIESASDWFDRTFVEGFLEPLDAGEHPLLKPIPIPAGAPDEGWNAILAAGGLEVLDLELIRAVESIIATNSWVSQAALEYNQYVRTVLVPVLDDEPDASVFYIDGSTRLRGKYLWYYHSLVTIQHGFQELQREVAAFEQILSEQSLEPEP